MLRKEWLVLLRDPVGLAVIFLMPLAVLVVITLVQDGAFKKVTQFSVTAAVVDEDCSAISLELASGLAAAEGVHAISENAGRPLERGEARALVRKGEVQVLVVFPKGLGEASAAIARHWAEAATSVAEQPPTSAPPLIETYFDPGVSGPYRMLVTLALQRLAQGMEFQLAMKAWGEALPGKISQLVPPAASLPQFDHAISLPAYPFGHTLGVAPPANATSGTGAGPEGLLPDMVQFNVPAYSVFAMFFIVIPISSCLLRERHEGTLTRLLTMPVRPSTIIAGKLGVFLAVSLIQFGLMLAAGHWLLPALGTPVFALSASLPALLALTLSTGLAAVGFALAVASTATSQEQAGMVGATLVVIFAALGGVMVPVWFMPPLMQRLSALTPLNWGVTAYQDLFARGASLAEIQGRLLMLAGFGCFGLAWAWRRLFKRA